jgi:hypothetical protein
MPNAPTPILGLIVPTVGGDISTWGGELNTDLATLDNLGATPVQVVNSNGTVGPSISPITIALAAGGVAGIIVLLSCPANKPSLFVVAKMDATVGVVTVTPTTGVINPGTLANYQLSNQGQYVWLAFDGVNYNVISAN